MTGFSQQVYTFVYLCTCTQVVVNNDVEFFTTIGPIRPGYEVYRSMDILSCPVVLVIVVTMIELRAL